MAELPLGITAKLITGQIESFYLTSSPFFVLAEKYDFMLRIGREVAADVAELGRIIAVDKKYSHNGWSQTMAIEQNRLKPSANQAGRFLSGSASRTLPGGLNSSAAAKR